MKENSKILILIAASLMFLSSVSIADGSRSNRDLISDSPVNSMVNGDLLDGTSTVVRHKDDVSFNFNTRHLTPGNAYTLWIMHFDKPRKCFDSCACTLSDFSNPDVTGGAIGAMAGRVADSYGQVSISNVVEYGVLPTGPAQVLIPNPIKNERSHFILALRDHGPASSDLVVLEQQLSSWTGGCAINGCNDVVISDHASPFCKVRHND